MSRKKETAKNRSDHEQEATYRTLFDSIDEGFVIAELLFDEDGKPFDLLVLETNASFERMMRTTNSVGKRALEIFPNAEASWFETYRRVVETGQSLRFENYLAALDSWFNLYIWRVGEAGSHRFAIVFNDITERKKAEQESRRANELLQATLDSSLEEIQLFKAIRDDTGTIVDFVWLFTNKKWNDHWGPMTGKRLLEENPGVVETGLFDKFIRVTESGVPVLHEQYYAHEQFNGWFLQSLVKVGDGFLTTSLEITERKRAEEALRESEAQHRALFDSIDEGVCLFERLPLRPDGRRDYRYIAMNPAMQAMFGIPDLSGQSIRDNFPDEVEDWYDDYDRVLETGQSIRFERESTPQGLVLEMYVTRLEDGSGRRLLAVMQDVTQRKQAEEKLRRSEERLRLIIAGAKGYSIFTTDADGVINSWNPGAAQIFGWSEAEILGQKGDVLFTPEDRASGEPRKELETARTEGVAPDIRWHQRKDGSRVFISGEVRPLGNGQLTGFAKIGRDLTAQRQAEEALRVHQEQLQLLNENLEQKVQEKTIEVRRLASDVINATQRERQRISRVLHDDVQQRIYAIQMQLSFVKNRLPREHDTGRRHISEIEKDLSEIVQITRNLSIDLSPSLPPGDGLAHAIECLISRIQEQYSLPVELQADGPFLIPKEELHVLLFNCVRELLFNIVKHARASKAVVALTWLENGIQIEVRDDGKGFPEHLSEKEVRKQVDVPRSLGIPTIRYQLSMFGGSMRINSKPGAGTQIILFAPIMSDSL